MPRRRRIHTPVVVRESSDSSSSTDSEANLEAFHGEPFLGAADCPNCTCVGAAEGSHEVWCHNFQQAGAGAEANAIQAVFVVEPETLAVQTLLQKARSRRRR